MSSFFAFVSCCFWHHCQRKSSRFGPSPKGADLAAKLTTPADRLPMAFRIAGHVGFLSRDEAKRGCSRQQRARSILQRQSEAQMFCLLILKMPWHPATKLLANYSARLFGCLHSWGSTLAA